MSFLDSSPSHKENLLLTWFFMIKTLTQACIQKTSRFRLKSLIFFKPGGGRKREAEAKLNEHMSKVLLHKCMRCKLM